MLHNLNPSSPLLISTDTTTTTRPRQRGFSKSQMSLHKILQIIASYSPPPSDSSNQGSSCSNHEAEKAADLCSAKRGIEIDLNEAAVAVSAGSSCLDCEAAAAVEESGEESMAVVVEKSSDGECDPIRNKDSSPVAEEDSRRFVEEEDTNLESCRVIGIGTDLGLSILIEAAELAASVSDDDSPPLDFETGKIEEEESEDSGSQSPSLKFGGGTEKKRKRKRNKCWVVDLYRETERTSAAEGKRKRGGGRKRSRVVVPSRNRDSSAVLDPPTPRRSSPRLTGGRVAEPLSTAAGKQKAM